MLPDLLSISVSGIGLADGVLPFPGGRASSPQRVRPCDTHDVDERHHARAIESKLQLRERGLSTSP